MMGVALQMQSMPTPSGLQSEDRMNRTQRGFTLIELLTVITITGLVIAIAVPRLRVSPQGKARAAAGQLVQDLELSRTRALASRRPCG